MNIEKKFEYWKEASRKDWAAVETLFKGGKYVHCLFFAHLGIEKLLKGLVVKKTRKDPPYTHNLVLLAELAKLEFNDETRKFFDSMNRFQISTRYPDFRFTLYK